MTPEQIQGEINALKSLFKDTDYNSNKIIESMILELKDIPKENFLDGLYLWIMKIVGEFDNILLFRDCYRKRINELEEMLEDES